MEVNNATVSLALLVIVALLVIKSSVNHILALRKVLNAIKNGTDGGILFMNPFNSLFVFIAYWIPPGRFGSLKNEFCLYRKYGTTCLPTVAFWDLTPAFWFADVDAIKTIASDRYTYPKDIELYAQVGIYGDNILSTEGSDWKRHRAIARPAFNEVGRAYLLHSLTNKSPYSWVGKQWSCMVRIDPHRQ
jgi:hypothetical protein